MKQQVFNMLQESIAAKQKFADTCLDAVVAVADRMISALQEGHKILVFGNGGSAADAQHFAAELINRMLIDRPPLPAIALTTDSSVLTSISNDYSYEEIFSKQIKALGTSGDVALGISTSGQSANVVKGLQAAREKGMLCLALSGRRGGSVAELADCAVVVEETLTPRIQEIHLTVIHCLCELIDQALFGASR